ncbi:hypothetical protein HPT27_04845 [Permianibacter sp. IMCC34836]|uniref:hypothetical protein n=1 Tax=Permianibacter fluminis TaxID=2738515 RepID=UPI001552C823|nr:hypothetical protein [Permianibacter fluminis]NQD36344.1 hypothetical protein [Permianibacter fluminis]
MASQLAQFFQQLAINPEYQRRYEAGTDSRQQLLQEIGLNADECALIAAQDPHHLHQHMMKELGMTYMQWNNNANNNTNNNIGKFKRADAATRSTH